ncbi:MAG: hypothetical protein AB8B56_18150 [Crocinitomicaceae bacterium]
MKVFLTIISGLLLTATIQAQTLSDLLDFENLVGFDLGGEVDRIESQDGCHVKFRVDDINNGEGLRFARYNDSTFNGYNSNDMSQPLNLTECPTPADQSLTHIANRIVGNGYGCHFLSANRLNTKGQGRSIFVIFSTPISMISGEILDIDISENWTVIAYEDAVSLNDPLDTFNMPLATNFELDSRGSRFVLSSRVSFSVLEFRLAPGHGTHGGFGIDNLMFCGSCCQ